MVFTNWAVQHSYLSLAADVKQLLIAYSYAELPALANSYVAFETMGDAEHFLSSNHSVFTAIASVKPVQ